MTKSPPTYRNTRAYDFCPGCSHGHVLDALNRALTRLQWDPTEVVIVTDIGCVGLSDQYFATSAFHGLHGRSLTYATGIKLARPDLHVIVLIGDGGCGIGGAHLLSAARRNIGVTTLVLNNLNFGMTGGEHSTTTPQTYTTATTPLGNIERPLDIAQTAAINGATYVWRGTAFDAALDQHIETALSHDGFAVLDIWELCTAYFASTNKIGPQTLLTLMTELGFQSGLLHHDDRPEFTVALSETRPTKVDAPLATPHLLNTSCAANLARRFAIVIAGSAGMHIRTCGQFLGTAATLSGLWATQRDDYPVTVRAGHSVSEVILAPEEIHYTGVAQPDALFIFSEDGLRKAKHYLPALTPQSWVFVTPELAELETQAHTLILDPKTFPDVPRSCWTIALVTAGIARLGILTYEALFAAAASTSLTYAHCHQKAVEAVLR